MTWYLDLAEFFWLAEQVTGLDTTTLVKASRVELADSALHAPQAGFGDEDFYLDPYDKAAVLTCRLAWNHPLPDGKQARSVGMPFAPVVLEFRMQLSPRCLRRSFKLKSNCWTMDMKCKLSHRSRAT